jgi:hypothetical protein
MPTQEAFSQWFVQQYVDSSFALSVLFTDKAGVNRWHHQFSQHMDEAGVNKWHHQISQQSPVGRGKSSGCNPVQTIAAVRHQCSVRYSW